MKTDIDPDFEKFDKQFGKKVRKEIAIILLASFILALLVILAIFGDYTINPILILCVVISIGLFWFCWYISKKIKEVKTDLKYKDEK
jgi:uncharacterized membrane protein YqjE